MSVAGQPLGRLLVPELGQIYATRTTQVPENLQDISPLTAVLNLTKLTSGNYLSAWRANHYCQPGGEWCSTLTPVENKLAGSCTRKKFLGPIFQTLRAWQLAWSWASFVSLVRVNVWDVYRPSPPHASRRLFVPNHIRFPNDKTQRT